MKNNENPYNKKEILSALFISSDTCRVLFLYRRPDVLASTEAQDPLVNFWRT